MNLEIRKYQEDLIKLTNEAQIPIEAKRLVMENVLRQVVFASEEILRKELEESQKEGEEDAVSKDAMDQ
jgi:hypothetical protein